MPLYTVSVRSACESLQICGYLSTFSLFCLGNCHIDALEPLFGVLLILGLEDIGFIVCEDFKSPRERAVPAFPAHNLHALYFAEFYWRVIRIVFLKCIWEVKYMSWLAPRVWEDLWLLETFPKGSESFPFIWLKAFVIWGTIASKGC